MFGAALGSRSVPILPERGRVRGGGGCSPEERYVEDKTRHCRLGDRTDALHMLLREKVHLKDYKV